MKYLLITSALMGICLVLGYLFARLHREKFKKPAGLTGMILITLFSSLFLFFVVLFAYFSIYYHAGEKAKEAMKGSDTVTVKEIDGGYFFDGPADDKALVFYSGGKVEPTAYAPLMLKLSEAGFDCFLADMPLRFAVFGSTVADKFIGIYEYDQWILAGHSLGGIAASVYAESHAEALDGIVLLASYSIVPVDDRILLCSIRGSEDGCLDMDQYEKYRSNMPQNAIEFIINGGNHAQFGDYGAQSGDGTAFISDEEQQKVTAERIAESFR